MFNARTALRVLTGEPKRLNSNSNSDISPSNFRRSITIRVTTGWAWARRMRRAGGHGGVPWTTSGAGSEVPWRRDYSIFRFGKSILLRTFIAAAALAFYWTENGIISLSRKDA